MDYQDKVKNTQAMKKALGAFYNVTKKLASEPNNSFKQLSTQNIIMENGIVGQQRGNYVVFSKRNENDKIRYDVVDTVNEQKIYENLMLKDAADAVTKYLSRGYSKYSPEVKRVLDLEETYAKNYFDALNFARKQKNSTKDTINETRFNQAKEMASAAKDQLNKIANGL